MEKQLRLQAKENGEEDQTPREDDFKSKMRYKNLVDWLEDYFFEMVRRRLGGQMTWCAKWWLHPEAISRLDALWLSWEFLKDDGALGMSNWWLSHVDPHMSVLMSRDNGPFASCKPELHRDDLKSLPHGYVNKRLFENTGFDEDDEKLLEADELA
jgi:hypothetical protein